MSRKSTPISQIPMKEAVVAPIGRETEEQINFARGAQRAAEKFALPQNSAALPTELLVSDDDNTIKELLNKFNRSPSSSPIQLPSSQPPEQPSAQPREQAGNPEQQHSRRASSDLREDDYDDVEESLIDRVLNAYGNDMQLFVGFFCAYVLAGAIPLHTVFSRYVFAIDRIAFSDIFVRALAGATVAYVVYYLLAPRRPASAKNA